MPRKLSIDEVKIQFESNGYTLISSEYAGSQKKLLTICSNGHNYETTYNNFRNGKRCPICSGFVLSFDYVYSYFKDNGCLLLSKEYKNNSTLLDYQCDCGNVSKIRFSDFQQGKRCKKCGSEKSSMKQRFTYEYVFNFFKENGCLLLTKEYSNNNQVLEYICSCGNKSTTLFTNFQKGHRCRLCGGKKLSEIQRFDYDFVKKAFEDNNCTLLEKEYFNCDSLLKYICSCGETYETSFYNFVRGHRCKRCRYEKISGENSNFWNGGLTKLNHYLRGKLSDWKTEVLKLNNYKCDITGKGGTLEVHHKYSFNKIIIEEIDQLNLVIKSKVSDYSSFELNSITENVLKRHTTSIGVPLLSDVHKMYHSLFGFDNDEYQYELFYNEFNRQ